MPINKLTISASVLFAVTSAAAQSNNNKHISWWPAYYLKYSINKKWIVNADIQARNFATQPVLGLFAFRTGAHYYISKQWSIGFGSAWFHQQQLNAEKKKIITDELRLWEDLRHELILNKWKIINQFRTEQRYWTKQDGIAFRFRYRLGAEYFFTERWKVMTGNEVMWQSSDARANWDQYRVWLGGEYAFNAKKQVQLVLMNWWQFNTHTHQPAIRINFIQSINATL